MIDSARHDDVLVTMTPQILPACVDLYVQTFNAEPWNDQWTVASATGRLEEMVEAPGFVGVALMLDATVTGVALGQVETWYSGRHFYLREMFVRVDLQRRGRGARLLAGVAARCPTSRPCT